MGSIPAFPLSVPTRATVRVYFQFLPDEDVDAEVRLIKESLDGFGAARPVLQPLPDSMVALFLVSA